MKYEQLYSRSLSLPNRKIIEIIKSSPLLQSVFQFYANENQSGDNYHFLSSFITTIIKNVATSEKGQRYDETIRTFALCCYILVGKNSYNFLRLNLPGSLPNLTTLNTLIGTNEDVIIECKFRFSQLQRYLQSFKVEHVFCAEDCTALVRKITYDVKTDTFIGFSTPLDNGVPFPLYFKTTSFSELQQWFGTIERAPLLKFAHDSINSSCKFHESIGKFHFVSVRSGQ